MDQRWINDLLLAPPSPALAMPDDLLLELAPPPLRKRDRDKRFSSWSDLSFHTVDRAIRALT